MVNMQDYILVTGLRSIADKRADKWEMVTLDPKLTGHYEKRMVFFSINGQSVEDWWNVRVTDQVRDQLDEMQAITLTGEDAKIVADGLWNVVRDKPESAKERIREYINYKRTIK